MREYKPRQRIPHETRLPVSGNGHAPMIRSMTGFARAEDSRPWGSLAWEIRAVNHRYLETAWRLPEELRQAEPAFRQALAARLQRGKVECTLRLRWSDEATRTIGLDEEALAALNQALALVADRLDDPAPVSPLDVIRWPGIVRAEEHDAEAAAEAAEALLGAALARLDEARRLEGGRIREMLLERCVGMEALVASVRDRLPEVRERIRERLEERVARLLAEPDRDRLDQELALLLQKMDVDEELDRLGSHLAEARRNLDSREAVGRRLDFLMQEFNREANTLASKSQDQETSRAAVEMKVLIEQMREQVQNVE